jgi:hypothetical protein
MDGMEGKSYEMNEKKEEKEQGKEGRDLGGGTANAQHRSTTRFATAADMDPRGGIAKTLAVDATDWTDILLTCRKWFASAVVCVEARQPLPPVMSDLSQNQSRDELQIKLALDAAVRREFPSTATWDPADLLMAAGIVIVRMHRDFLHITHMDQKFFVEWISGAYGVPSRLMKWCVSPATASARASTMAIEAAVDGYTQAAAAGGAASFADTGWTCPSCIFVNPEPYSTEPNGWGSLCVKCGMRMGYIWRKRVLADTARTEAVTAQAAAAQAAAAQAAADQADIAQKDSTDAAWRKHISQDKHISGAQSHDQPPGEV